MSDEYKPLSSASPDPQLLLESGPMMIRDFNPKGVLRFQGRKCVTCDAEIMDHWLRSGSQEYWCPGQVEQTSEGITDTVWDVPDGFGIPAKVQPSPTEQHRSDMSDKKWDE